MSRNLWPPQRANLRVWIFFLSQVPRATPNPRPCWAPTHVTHPLTTLGASTPTSQGLSLSITAPNCPLALSTPRSSTPVPCRVASPSCLTLSPPCFPRGRQVRVRGERRGKPEGQMARQVVSQSDSACHPTRGACRWAGQTSGPRWGRGRGWRPTLRARALAWGWERSAWEPELGRVSRAPRRDEQGSSRTQSRTRTWRSQI